MFAFSANGFAKDPLTPAEDILEFTLEERVLPIDIKFDGVVLKVTGATNIEGKIVFVVTGSIREYSLFEKKQINDIWVQKEVAELGSVPSFYALLSSDFINVDAYKDSPFEIGAINHSFAINSNKSGLSGSEVWRKVVELKQRNKEFIYAPRSIKRIGKYLFQLEFKMPSNIKNGTYGFYAFVIDKDGNQKGFFYDHLEIKKSYFVNAIYESAQNHPVLYAILVILINIIIGLFVGLRSR